MRLLSGVLHGAEGPPGLGGDIEGAGGVPAARDSASDNCTVRRPGQIGMVGARG